MCSHDVDAIKDPAIGAKKANCVDGAMVPRHMSSLVNRSTTDETREKCGVEAQLIVDLV